MTTASPFGCCATTAWRMFIVFQSLGNDELEAHLGMEEVLVAEVALPRIGAVDHAVDVAQELVAVEAQVVEIEVERAHHLLRFLAPRFRLRMREPASSAARRPPLVAPTRSSSAKRSISERGS